VPTTTADISFQARIPASQRDSSCRGLPVNPKASPTRIDRKAVDGLVRPPPSSKKRAHDNENEDFPSRSKASKTEASESVPVHSNTSITTRTAHTGPSPCQKKERPSNPNLASTYR